MTKFSRRDELAYIYNKVQIDINTYVILFVAYCFVNRDVRLLSTVTSYAPVAVEHELFDD